MRLEIASAAVLAALLAGGPVWAQQQKQSPPRDAELDVTMQVLTDPDAVRPSEIVHRIPLPLPASQRASEARAEAGSEGAENGQRGQETAEQARAPGQEAAEQARERAREAAEQRGDIGRSIAEEARRNPGPPEPPPGPPDPPPRAP